MFEREHLKRLLACTILLRHAGHMEIAQRHSLADFFLETSATSLVQLVRGTFALSPDFLPPALGFVGWFLGSQAYARLQPFAAFSALLLMGRLTGYSDKDLIETLAWADEVEAQCRVVVGTDTKSERWLIGLSGYQSLRGGPERWLDAARRGLAGRSIWLMP